MLCTNNNVLGDVDCGGNGDHFGCIINLIIILIVLQFLTSIINGNGCGGNCC